jgi:hypothetical protein
MNMPAGGMLLALVLAALGALVCLLASLRATKRRRLVKNLPTSKTTGVFIGLVELKGTAEAEQPLVSFLAGQRCVCYQFQVEEHWSRTVTETYTDKDGRTQRRTRHESGWTTVAQGGEMIPFYLKDDCGVIRVLPEGAKIEPKGLFEKTCGRADPLYYGKGPAQAVADSAHRRRFTESGIPLHAALYVIGQARERTDLVAAEIAHDQSAPLFLISTRSEEKVTARLGWGAAGWWLLGWLMAVGAGVGLAGAVSDSPAPVIAAGGGYLIAWAVGWAWMAYNSLIDLRQRVRQGWSQVEVQLKRRHDLIPRLVASVQGPRDYERNLQTELAGLRAQLAATPPGVTGPDFRACTRQVLAIVERYPELETQEAFLSLQQQLIETAQRIALARGYFNEIASFYNGRLEMVPDRLLARLGRLEPQALMTADDFERAPMCVELAA